MIVDMYGAGAKLHVRVEVRRFRPYFAKSLLNYCFTLFHDEVDPGGILGWVRPNLLRRRHFAPSMSVFTNGKVITIHCVRQAGAEMV